MTDWDATPMTFAECHAAVGCIVPGDYAVRVDAWRQGNVRWEAWIPEYGEHIHAATPEALIERVRYWKPRGEAMKLEEVRT